MTKKLNILGSAVAALMIVGCGGGSDSDTPSQEERPPEVEYHPYDAPAISDADKNEYLNLINAARSQEQNCGSEGIMPAVPPLAWSDALYSSAYEHSEDMATSSVYTHEGSGTASDWTAQILELGRGSSFSERISNNGYFGGGMAENITASDTSASAAMGRWMKSDGHCANIMGSYYTVVGMATVRNGSSEWKQYWTQNFGG